ncbi:O-antigen ligase family protein [Salinibacterium sp. ZJ77]|uniref:O-antigen ligase family protein n=1 Tax=Salinibacterium sp. ZJ77 TaxID=2708337 RepID=UPI0014221F6C|nr:O-antigen ligase family protein [Salinibacterium sp. ZJ77]
MSRLRPQSARAILVALLRSPRFASVLVTVSVAISALGFLIVRLMGWPGYLAMLTGVIVLMVCVVWARLDEIDLVVPPLSLLVFLGWAAISSIWSEYQWVTLGGVSSLFAFTFIGLFIVYMRDTLQTVRAWGDVLRVILGASLGMEIFAGIIIDTAIPYLGIQARIAELGPISGLLQNRNQLGMLALIGAVTFATELRTRSVRPLTGVLSLVGASACLLLTRSPIIILAAVVVGFAAAVLYGVRHVSPERRQAWQFAILGIAVALIVGAWTIRGSLVALFNAEGALTYRLQLWQKIVALLPGSFVEGWGWTGRWHTDIAPYLAFTTSSHRPAPSALNAYLDVLFQLGSVGLVIFVGMLGLAFVRSWLLAGHRRSILYAWPALVMIVLLLVNLAESSILVDFGWLTFVVCCATASRELSWRSAVSAPPAPGTLSSASE